MSSKHVPTVEEMQKAGEDGRSQRKERDVKPGERTPWLKPMEGEPELMQRLIAQANVRGHTLKELADALDITYGYVTQLRTGHRQMSGVSSNFIDHAARYLAAPRISIMYWAGKISDADLFVSDIDYKAALVNAVSIISSDPHFGRYVTADILDLPEDKLNLIVRLYEGSTGTKLLPDNYRPVPQSRTD